MCATWCSIGGISCALLMDGIGSHTHSPTPSTTFSYGYEKRKTPNSLTYTDPYFSRIYLYNIGSLYHIFMLFHRDTCVLLFLWPCEFMWTNLQIYRFSIPVSFSLSLAFSSVIRPVHSFSHRLFFLRLVAHWWGHWALSAC